MFTKNNIKMVEEEYERILEDRTFANRYDAAYNYADNMALCIAWKHYGIKFPADKTAEVRCKARADASKLRIMAIGE